jgi:hypothetical protein
LLKYLDKFYIISQTLAKYTSYFTSQNSIFIKVFKFIKTKFYFSESLNMTRNYHPTISNATINLINSLPEYTIINGKPVRQFIKRNKSFAKMYTYCNQDNKSYKPEGAALAVEAGDGATLAMEAGEGAALAVEAGEGAALAVEAGEELPWPWRPERELPWPWRPERELPWPWRPEMELPWPWRPERELPWPWRPERELALAVEAGDGATLAMEAGG